MSLIDSGSDSFVTAPGAYSPLPPLDILLSKQLSVR